MRFSRLSLGIALAAMAFAAPAGAPVETGGFDPLGLRPARGKDRRGKGQNNRRGKGLRAKPKKRPNRLTISKRVRRKHRRAA